MARFLGHTLKELKQTAEVLGTEPIGGLWAGLSAQQPEQAIQPGARRRAARLGRKLVLTEKRQGGNARSVTGLIVAAAQPAWG